MAEEAAKVVSSSSIVDTVKLIGRVIPAGQSLPGRDAIHVAVIPMIALTTLRPGQRLENGVVDPFLTTPVSPGEYYWLFLEPGSVTSLRHVWQHPAFDKERM